MHSIIVFTNVYVSRHQTDMCCLSKQILYLYKNIKKYSSLHKSSRLIMLMLLNPCNENIFQPCYLFSKIIIACFNRSDDVKMLRNLEIRIVSIH